MQSNLEREFERRRPWITRFTIEGRQYGGELDLMNVPWIPQFFEVFSGVQTIMELGSLEGGNTFSLAKHPGVKRVLGIEGRETNLEKARFVQGILGVENVEFVLGNLTMSLSAYGGFDAVFCSGLLYHLPEPWKLIEQLPSVSSNLFLWTHYAPEDCATEVINGLRGMKFRESGLVDPLSGLSPYSFWPTLGSLLDMLKVHGYKNICILEVSTRHVHGPVVILAATCCPESIKHQAWKWTRLY